MSRQRAATIVLLSLGVACLCACDDSDRERRELARQQAQELQEKRERETAADQQAFGDRATGERLLAERLAAWVSARDGFLILEHHRTSGPVLRTVPASTPWTVTCEFGALVAAFSPANREDDDRALDKRLSRARLTPEQCRDYVAFAAKWLSDLKPAEGR